MTAGPTLTDGELLRRAEAGDREAFSHALASAVEARLHPIRKRWRVRRAGPLVLGGAVVTGAALAATGAWHPTLGGSERGHPRTVAAAVVQPLPAGWSQTDDGPNLLTARGARASTTIASWDYTPGRAGPAADMPKEGILITALLFRTGGPSLCDSTPRLRGYPNRSTAHLSLHRAERGALEGVPQTPELRIRGRHDNDYNFEVRVAIRSAAPRPDLVARAQRVLAHLHFPQWPHGCT